MSIDIEGTVWKSDGRHVKKIMPVIHLSCDALLPLSARSPVVSPASIFYFFLIKGGSTAANNANNMPLHKLTN